MFAIHGFCKSTDIDSFEEGCIGGGMDCYIDYPLGAETIAELKEKVAEFVGCKVADMELDACEEPGRIDAGRTETADGDEATVAELEQWKAGNLELYYAVYSCTVVECKPVSVA